MKRKVKKVLLMDGTIRKINFNQTRESVMLEFSDHIDTTVEFKNAKIKRADHVKKLRLNVGDHVIVSGSTNGESNCYMYGYDVQRSGYVSSGEYFLVKGTVQEIKEMASSSIMNVSENFGKNIEIKFSKRVFSGHINIGDVVTCMCIRSIRNACISKCENWGFQKCAICTKKRKSYRFDALEITECAA